MLPLYVIRNTTKLTKNNEFNLDVLVECVRAFVEVPCEIVVIDPEEQVITDSCYPIINLDPFSRKPDHYKLDICRQFSLVQEVPVGFASRTPESIESQLSRIPLGNYIIVDDDISSGATKRFVESKTKHLGVIDYISLLHLWCENNGYYGRQILDCIDTHDFWGDLPSSGLVVNGAREYYWSDKVDLEARAKLKHGAAKYLKENLKQ